MKKQILLLALLGAAASSGQAQAESAVAFSDLSLSFEGPATMPLPGSNIVVELTIHNDGDFAAEEAIVSLDIPEDLIFLSATAVGGSYSDADKEWTTGFVDSFASSLLTLNLMVAPDSPATIELIADLLSFTGSYGSYDVDSTPGNRNPCEDDYASLLLTIAGVPAPDAGLGPDAGPGCGSPIPWPDAGPGGPDGGGLLGGDAGMGDPGGSGGCAVAGSSGSGWPLLLLSFGIALYRRRRRAEA